MTESPAALPADLTRRMAETERRQDRLETEVSSLVKAVDQMTEKLSGFLREYNQRSRTDWKAIIGLIGALGTIGTAAIAGVTWIIMTIETGRDDRIMTLIEAMHASNVEAGRQRDAAHARLVDSYRREADAHARRIERLEGLQFTRPAPRGAGPDGG